MLILMILHILNIYSIFKTVHLTVIGLILCVGIFWLGSLISKPKYYGEPSWQLGKAVGKSGPAGIDENEKSVLGRLRDGFAPGLIRSTGV